MGPSAIEKYRAAEQRLWDHYGLSPTEHFVRLPAYHSQVRVLEVGQGAPVLFVHGSPNAAPKWAPLAAHVLDFRCLLLDRPGCGLSEPIDYNRVDLRLFGADLLGMTLDGLNVSSAAVVASSFGGALAVYFARAYPERVLRLVQEGCPALVRGFRVPLYNLGWSVLGLLGGPTPRSEAAFRQMGHATSIERGRFQTEVLVWRDALMRYTATARHENQLNRHLASRMRRYSYGAEELEHITPPTLYLWGKDDPFGGVELGRRSAAAQPNATLRAFAASGHLPWLDDPATHAQYVRAFLRDEPMERLTGAPDHLAALPGRHTHGGDARQPGGEP